MREWRYRTPAPVEGKIIYIPQTRHTFLSGRRRHGVEDSHYDLGGSARLAFSTHSISPLYTPSNENVMQLPHSDKLVTRSQGPLPVSENGRASEPEESDGQQKTAESLVGRHEAKIHAQKAKIHVLRTSKEKYARKYEAAKKRIAGLEDTVRKASRIHQQNLERQDKHIQAIEDELALAQDLLSARTKELSGAQSFLSTTDRLSEAEVLCIVRDLNENIFQVTTNLAEEWEKLALSLPARLSITPENSLDNFSRFYGSTLIYRSFQWDPTAVTYLIQSCLCYFATEMTSSWRRSRNDGEELKILASVYEHLSAFGEHLSRAASGMRRLTVTHARGASNISQMEILDSQPPC